MCTLCRIQRYKGSAQTIIKFVQSVNPPEIPETEITVSLIFEFTVIARLSQHPVIQKSGHIRILFVSDMFRAILILYIQANTPSKHLLSTKRNISDPGLILHPDIKCLL